MDGTALRVDEALWPYFRAHRGCRGDGVGHHTDIPWDYEWDGFQLGGHQLNRFTMNRHDGRANLVFLDGDARSVPLADMWQLLWNKHYTPQYVTLPWVE